MCFLKMKSHEESHSKKEKSTEDKTKETGKIPIQNACVKKKKSLFPTGTRHVFIDTIWLNEDNLLSC